jgi:transposase, IS30 family
MKGNLMNTKTYTHLTQEERYQIFAYLERKIPISEIALALGRHKSTIYREINRGQKEDKHKQYSPRKAHFRYKNNRRKNAKNKRYKGLSKKYVLNKLNEEWSPEQIAGRLKIEHPEQAISHETIYQHIWRDKKEGGKLYKKLRCRGRKYKKRGAKNNDRGIFGRVDIEERAEIVEEKKRIGDWEEDLVLGAKSSGALTTMVDRASKLTKIGYVVAKNADLVRDEMIKIMLPLKENAHTITYDNGREFVHHQGIGGALSSKIYFAKPYHSWERGLNEHTNGLIRQYLPKGESFEGLTREKIQMIENLLNNRPRKVLGYRTPNEVFFHGFPTHALVAPHS